jgi:hypothetical protein
MGSISRRLILAVSAFLALVTGGPGEVRAQVETVPAGHPVYTFLKRMEVKEHLGRYFDSVLPLSRANIADLLSVACTHEQLLTPAEREILEDFRSEFRLELGNGIAGVNSVIDPGIDGVTGGVGEMFGGGEQYLYAYRDSTLTFFANGLLMLDTRGSAGDTLGGEKATFVQFGGRFRGTILGHLGYFLQGTNAQFWGSRDLLARDPHISQSHALHTADAENFDFVDGYVRYDARPVSVQIGRERVLWGSGYDQHMVLSESPRVFDFIRADVEYRSLKYTFLHAWLLGRQSSLTFSLPPDTIASYVEPLIADKYFAAHRLEFSFPSLMDIGAQEMVVYSNRAPDLAYLNPFTVIESAQRSRGERDNVMWAFDVQTRFLPGVQLSGTVLFDDLHFGQFFDDYWYNRYGYQAGVFITDPFSVPDISLVAEYTRIEPYTFAHNRSRDNDFGSLGAILGPRIGPNADSWFFRVDCAPRWNLRLSVGVLISRKGENVVDASGALIRNVGGDILQPHRDTDPERRTFLDGVLVKNQAVDFQVSWEPTNQLWVEALYRGEFEERPDLPGTVSTHTVIFRVHTEL